jgi:hypothetical protein
MLNIYFTLRLGKKFVPPKNDHIEEGFKQYKQQNLDTFNPEKNH